MDKYTKRDSTGSVDVAASAQAYADALTVWAADNEVPSDTIEAAVNAVLDRFPGQRIPKPALISLSVSELNGTPAQHKTLSERVSSFLKGQVDAGKLFAIKGTGGGMSRTAPVKK